jgi:hypothetical protein
MLVKEAYPPKRDEYHSNEGICQEERDMTRSYRKGGIDKIGWTCREGRDTAGKEGYGSKGEI